MSDPFALPYTTSDPPHSRDTAATRLRWVERLDQFRAAEQIVAGFCAAEVVSIPAFYQWKRQLVAKNAGPADPRALLPSDSPCHSRRPSNWYSPVGLCFGSLSHLLPSPGNSGLSRADHLPVRALVSPTRWTSGLGLSSYFPLVCS